ncbi:NUDIX domain-containing protein, partial [bacterium]|nr:NUDIX domain-containing protein [bacterium]
SILLVKHKRAGREYYVLPGGGLEWGETCVAGLAREFREELELEVVVGRLLMLSESIEPQGRRHILNLTFRARIIGGSLKLNPDRRIKGVDWISRERLMSLEFYPEIRKELLNAWKQKFRSGIMVRPTVWN